MEERKEVVNSSHFSPRRPLPRSADAGSSHAQASKGHRGFPVDPRSGEPVKPAAIEGSRGSVRIDRHAFGGDRAGDEVLVHTLPVQVGTANRSVDVAVEIFVSPVNVSGIDCHAPGAERRDEALVHVLPVQVGTADRPDDEPVAPVDVAGIDRHAKGFGGAGDEAIVYVLPIQVGTADRPVETPDGPVDVGGIDSHADGGLQAGDEVLVHVLPVQVRTADRVGVVGAGVVCPVDVTGIDRNAGGAVRAGDEALVYVLPVQVGTADRIKAGVRPVDVAGIHRHRDFLGWAGDVDEGLVHVLPIYVGTADLRMLGAVTPVDVAGSAAGSGERETRGGGGLPAAGGERRGVTLAGRGGAVHDGDAARLPGTQAGRGAGVGSLRERR